MHIIATDGSCANQRKEVGAWALSTSEGTILSGYEYDTTSQRCEILAVIGAIRFIAGRLDHDPEEEFGLVIDSAYVANCLKNTWFRGWQRNGWITSSGTDVKNKDLWTTIAELYPYVEDNVSIYLINGHIMVNKPESLEKALAKFSGNNGVTPPMNVFLSMAKLNRDADELAVSVRKAMEYNLEIEKAQ